MNQLDAMVTIKANYGQHPGDARFCKKCQWAMIPPAYPGDYWDCTNSDCGQTQPSSQALVRKMKGAK